MFRAGAARVDISPAKGAQLFGYPHVRRLATGVHDPLWVSCLAIQNDTGGCVLGALDLLFLDPPAARSIRRRVADAVGAREEAVFISCTHTHSGPVTSTILGWEGDVAMPDPDCEYLGRVADCVVECAMRAAEAMRPARVAWTRASAPGVGGNRHDPNGPSDPEAGVLVVREEDGEVIGISVVYGMHPTVLHEDSTLVSSDFPHYVRLALMERFGPKTVVLYHTGPAGDQSPRYHVRGQTFSEAERLGRTLGGCVGDAVGALNEGSFMPDAVIEGRLACFEPVRRAIPSAAEAERMLDEYRADFDFLRTVGADRARVRTAECAVFGAEAAVSLAKALESGTLGRLLGEYVPFEIQAVRIGDGVLVGLPGEVFCEYGKRIKKAWPGKVFVVSLVNGHMQGYITTREAAERGGYEAAGAVFDWRTGDVMVQAARRVVEQLFTGNCEGEGRGAI